MSIRTFLKALVSAVSGAPKALHLATIKDAVEADFNRACAKAVNDYDAARARIAAEVEHEVEVVKTLIDGARNRIVALAEHELTSFEHTALVRDIEAVAKKVLGEL